MMRTLVGSARNILALAGVLIKSNARGLLPGAGAETVTGTKGADREKKGAAGGGPGARGGTRTGGADRRRGALLVVLALCLMPSAGLMAVTAWRLVGAAKALGMEHVLIGLYLSGLSMVTLVLCLYHVVNLFYLSGGYEGLLSLPLRPYEVLFAKFLSVLAYELVAQLYLLAPPLIIYGIRCGTPPYWIYAALLYCLFPVAPLTLASLLALPIRPLIRRIRNRDSLASVINVLFLVLIVVISMLSTGGISMSRMSEAEIGRLLTAGGESALGLASRVFPTLRAAALAFAHSGSLAGLGDFTLFVALNAACVLVFALAGRAFFGSGAAMPEIGYRQANAAFDRAAYLKGGGKGRTGMGRAAARSEAVHGLTLLRLYILKELRVIFRTPTYFLNCATVAFIWPIFLLLPATVRIWGTGSGGTGNLLDMLATFKTAVSAVPPVELAPATVGVAYAAGLVFGALTSVAPTCVSREGGDFVFNKYMPLTFGVIAWGKVLPSVILGGVSLLIGAVLAFAVAGPPLWLAAIFAPAALAGLLTQGFLGMTFDLLMPKLHWDDEAAAVKQNFNVLVSLGAVASVAALALFCALTSARAAGSVAAGFCLTAAAVLTLTAAAWAAAVRLVGPRRFRKIE